MAETPEKSFIESIRKWRILVIVAILVSAILISLVALVIYSTNIRVETWAMERTYDEGGWLSLSRFTIQINVVISHPSIFSAVVRDLKVRVVVNGVDMGAAYFSEEWYIIHRSEWRVWKFTFSVTGAEADSLGQANTYTVYTSLRGVANCYFYTNVFESTYQRTYTF